MGDFNLWITVLLSLLVVGMAIWFGYFLRSLSNQIKSILRMIETSNENDTIDSAVVDTTPNLIREKERKGELDTDDSQVVTIKSPAQVRADKDRKLNEELDKLGR